MTDINDEYTKKALPPKLKYDKVGTKHVVLIESCTKVPVYDFVNNRPNEQLFFQNKKKVKQSELDTNLPFDPIPCWLIIGRLKDGTEVIERLEGEKLKQTRKAIKEGGRLVPGGMIAIEYTADDPESKGPFPKKLYTVQLKAPQE